MPFSLPSVRTALRTIAVPILWSASVAVPAGGPGWLDGVPLGPIEAAAIALVWWAWAAQRRLPGERLLVALLVAKIAIAAVFIDRGFEARYHANGTWAAPVERSTDFRDRPYTRRDERLAFGDRWPDLPLYFFNDLRFNLGSPTDPNREWLAYSVVWKGFLFVDDERRPTTFYVAADPRASGGLSVDGRRLVVLDLQSPRTGSGVLQRGWRHLHLSVAVPYGGSRRFEAGELVADTRRPFDRSRVFPRPVTTVRLAIDTMAAWTIRGVDGAMLVWLAGLILLRARRDVRDAHVGRLLWLGAILEAIWYAWPYVGRVTTLSGGGDMLMYEHLSRVILLGDPLLAARGPGGGQGAPFYFQPLYPYFLSLAHLAFGEDLFGIAFLQRLLVAATVAWMAAMTSRFFGPRAGWVAVIAGGLCTYAKLGRWSDVLLAEPLFTPILAAWSWMLVKLSTEPASSARSMLTGVVGGLATLTRSTLLIAWPVILPLWWASLPAKRNRLLAVLLVTMIGIIGLATLRNWIVADRFVPVATSFGINLYLGNKPPRPLDVPAPGRTAVYDTLGLEQNVRTVLEFAIQEPDVFGRGLVNKALYSAGFFGWSGLPGGIGTSWVYVGMWLFAALGIARIVRAGRPWGTAVWLPAAAGFTHFGAVVLIFPHGYTDRLIVPLYPLLIPYAAYALEPLPSLVFPVTAALRRAADVASGWVRRHLVPVAMPVVRQPRNWFYLAYIAGASSQSAGPLTAMLLPVTTLVITGAARRERVHRVIGVTLWTGALVRIAAGGSLSPDALHDPLFWGVIAAAALGASAITGRWAVIAAATAAFAGGFTMTAILLPLFPGSEAGFPNLDRTTMNASVAALSREIGLLAALCLLAVWLQAIVAGGMRGAGMERLAAGARGALLTALVLFLAGAVPDDRVNAPIWLVALGALLGLVEAKARGSGRLGVNVRSAEQPQDEHHHR